MARIFSIRFTYDDVLHHAMITVRNTPFFTEYSVAMLDDAIAGLLPNTKIIFTGNNFVFSDSTDANSPQLMQTIIQAIVAQLQPISAYRID